MRELKYHEKKLLKKVDFLNVGFFLFLLVSSCLLIAFLTPFSSGSKTVTFEKSKS